MDFTENRFRGYCDRVLSGDILCETGNEDETCFQRHTGWYPDHASGTSRQWPVSFCFCCSV